MAISLFALFPLILLLDIKRNGTTPTLVAIGLIYLLFFLLRFFLDAVSPLLLIYLSFALPLAFFFVLFMVKVTDSPEKKD